MLRQVITVLLSFLIAAPVWGCDKNVYYLVEGDKAPCTGYLFSPEKELELRLLDTNYKYLQEESRIKDSLIDLYKDNDETTSEIVEKERQKAELWRNVAEKNTLELVKTKDSQGKRDWMFFVGGILATVAAGYAIGQASK